MANPYQSKIDAYRRAAEEKNKPPLNTYTGMLPGRYINYANDYGIDLSAHATTDDSAARRAYLPWTDEFKQRVKAEAANASIEGGFRGMRSGMTDTANPAPTVETEYQKQQDLLDMEQKAANRNSVTAYQRAMKYLPQMQKEQGLYGLGVSESGQIAAKNDLMSRMAQIDLYYDQLREQNNANRSSQYLQMAEAQMENATNLNEIRDIADRYKPYLSADDQTTLDLYISQVESPAYQERVLKQQAAASISTDGGWTFKHNYVGGFEKGGSFVIEEKNGKNRNAEIEEIITPAANDPLTIAADDLGDEQLFVYKDRLYMVKDDPETGKRLIMKLKLSQTAQTNMLNAYRNNA